MTSTHRPPVHFTGFHGYRYSSTRETGNRVLEVSILASTVDTVDTRHVDPEPCGGNAWGTNEHHQCVCQFGTGIMTFLFSMHRVRTR